MEECEDSNNEIETNRLKFANGKVKTLAEKAREAAFNSNYGDLMNCVDEEDVVQIENRKFNQSSSRPIERNGVYTIDAVDDLLSQYQSNFVLTASNGTKVAEYTSVYGNDFYESLENLNNLIANSGLGDYEFLRNRFSVDNPITTIEYAEFLNNFMFTPLTLNNAIVEFPNRLLSQINDFYNNNFTQNSIGAFCALMPQVFEAIDFFFDALDFIQGGIAGVINKLKQATLRELIEKIVNEVKDVIERKIKSELEKILNFKIEDFFEEVETFISERLILRVEQIKEDILRFFDPENIRKIVDSVEGLVSYAVSVFTNPSIEVIQFLVYRFCSFAAQVEKVIDMIKNPLVDFSSGINGIIQRLRVVSNVNTAAAIAAGAWRYSPEQRQILINTSEEEFRAKGNPAPATPAEASDPPSWEQLSSGTDSRLGVRLGNQSFASSPRGQTQAEGWTGVNKDVKVKLMRVQARFGRRLTITSGYRNPLLNKGVGGRQRRGNDPNTGSQHLNGNALDLTWDGFNGANREEFISIALDEGFRGIGRYSEFVHIDIGPRRSWTG